MEEIKSRKWWYLALLIFVGMDSPTFASVSDFNTPQIATPSLVLASNTFIFNPRSLSWKAVQNGKVIKSGKASGGSKYCRDIGRSCRTPSGTYQVFSKGGADCRSTRYPLGKGGAKMPYCMFYSKNYAIHGSYDVPNHNASHGCIRIQPDAARWLNKNFMQIGTTVIVQPY